MAGSGNAAGGPREGLSRSRRRGASIRPKQGMEPFTPNPLAARPDRTPGLGTPHLYKYPTAAVRFYFRRIQNGVADLLVPNPILAVAAEDGCRRLGLVKDRVALDGRRVPIFLVFVDTIGREGAFAEDFENDHMFQDDQTVGRHRRTHDEGIGINEWRAQPEFSSLSKA
jgi:hypothetical protein